MIAAHGPTCWACGVPVDVERLDDHGYVRCCACGLRFYPSGEAPREIYDDCYFAAYRGGNYFATEILRRHEARIRLALVRGAAGSSATDLLEIGCAAGFFLDEARHAGWRVRGIEPADGPAEYARHRLGLDVVSAFAEDAEIESNSVDAACLWHTLEHIPRPGGLLHHVRTGLRPGGALLVEVPNADSVLAHRLGGNWFALEPDVHVAQWTPNSLRTVLENCGYAVESVSTVPFLTYVAGCGRRLPRRVWLALRQRAWLRNPHPSGHDLLRAVARRPDA